MEKPCYYDGSGTLPPSVENCSPTAGFLTEEARKFISGSPCPEHEQLEKRAI
ncbi:hypothetical protein V1498_03550 [Peribacillus sp. SCS-26]|uniref:hypothetical protein n=1 Tax=Paraperibacillus marinus TaxID=3115295 RepID=UPI0039065611